MTDGLSARGGAIDDCLICTEQIGRTTVQNATVGQTWHHFCVSFILLHPVPHFGLSLLSTMYIHVFCPKSDYWMDNGQTVFYDGLLHSEQL